MAPAVLAAEMRFRLLRPQYPQPSSSQSACLERQILRLPFFYAPLLEISGRFMLRLQGGRLQIFDRLHQAEL